MNFANIKVLSFGEILWDKFRENQEIGGAPLNFSAHLAKLGAEVHIVSSVGRDVLGNETLNIIKSLNISCDLVSTNSFPTGVCLVSMDENGHPSYQLVENMAYDNIVLEQHQLSKIQAGFDVFYFGTLAQRSPVSTTSLKQILSEFDFKEVFCDLNIRQSYYNRKTIKNCLHNCTILKISREEYHVFEELNISPFRRHDFADDIEFSSKLCQHLSQKYNIKIIIVTMDKNGSIVYSSNTKELLISEKPKNKAISTVGAGDSFCACFIYNYMNGTPLQECIDRSVKLSDYVVTQLGAIPNYPKKLLDFIM
ncbi:MAG: PfkB protein [Oscillospiraceae bacterium]|jgi:fructokinase|nr:PfkB protein [Oscillospiraceae bacterium]